MAEVRIGAIQMRGFFTIFPSGAWMFRFPEKQDHPICFREGALLRNLPFVHSSLLQQLPPASPVRPSAAQIAADRDRKCQCNTHKYRNKDSIRNGCRLVAHIIIFPTFIAALPSAGAHHADRATPTPIVTSGVTRISILVSLDTAFPISEAKMATNNTASGAACTA